MFNGTHHCFVTKGMVLYSRCLRMSISIYRYVDTCFDRYRKVGVWLCLHRYIGVSISMCIHYHRYRYVVMSIYVSIDTVNWVYGCVYIEILVCRYRYIPMSIHHSIDTVRWMYDCVYIEISVCLYRCVYITIRSIP